MVRRFFTALFATLLLLQLPGAALAQSGNTQEPYQDPLEIWRLKPPGDYYSNEYQEQQKNSVFDRKNRPPPPQSSMPVAPPPAPPPAKVWLGSPRTLSPVGDDTELFERKEFVVNSSKVLKNVLTYYWKAPKGFSDASTKKYPLVVVLHDKTGYAPAGHVLLKKEYRDDFPAYILVPVLSAGKIWDFPDEFPDDPTMGYMSNLPKGLPDVVALLPGLLDEYPMIDYRRIYLVGCAEGGFGAYGAALKYKDIFAGIVPINGGWAIKQSTSLLDVPMFVQHGEKDVTVDPKYSRDVAFYIQRYGGKISYIHVPGLAHSCDDLRVYSRTMWEWLFGQRLDEGKLKPKPKKRGSSSH
ncbi:MAG: hypothetical protein ACAH83_16110 [Alphaproteobacteria bacterium]